MDKTVKELAQELGLTAQAVYARLDKIDRASYTRKRNNRTYITPEGQDLIKGQGTLPGVPKGPEVPEVPGSVTDLVDALKQQIKTLESHLNETNSLLKDQLEKKDKQLEDQIALNRSLTVLFAQTQQLLTGKDITQALSNGLKPFESNLNNGLTNDQNDLKAPKARRWRGFRALFKKDI
ncbi:MAG TPA: hypothetical protein VFD14_05505 [Clostridia bacterium]|nr:hypothetical protein [Clostridia bacterium]